MNNVIFEVVIDSIHSALAAEQGGANRVELCDNLFDGGTTPSAGTIKVVRKNLKIDVNIMIRPRGGDFLYSDLEFEIMKNDINIAKSLGANGVVFGILLEDGSIDVARTEELIKLARPLNVTFHRAFDMVRDPYKALDELIQLKVDRILSSGLERTAMEGAELLKDLIEKSKGKIIIMPGGGITERNIGKIYQVTKAKEFHISGRKKVESKMSYRKNHLFMGGELRLDEYGNSFSDAGKISNIMKNI
jgi:copper homeostasis protein